MQSRLRKNCHIPMFVIVLVASLPGLAQAQDGPPQYVRDAVQAVEDVLSSNGDAALQTFVDDTMVPSTDRDRTALINRLRAMRDEVGGPWNGLAVEAEPDGVLLLVSTDGSDRQIKVVLGPEGISDIRLLEAEKSTVLTRENLEESFDRFASDGFSGVVYVRLGGDVVLERAFGNANEDLGIPNDLTTIFGVGSRPIDFTIAAIYLLEQQGTISRDDVINKYFEDVPADKQKITIRHLMSGQSGLPDFFDVEDDWDPDLAWVDRQTAERGILAQELLFEPGQDRRHSHGAFGLLAALVERVSGQSYYRFIRNNFLDPAGMNRTGEYGESRGLSVSDFAAGGGPSFVGLPNIPPNWGPTSWLVKGSGGMYSCLGDLMKFYEFVRNGDVFENQYREAFRRDVANVDGSERGFELFSAFNPKGNEAYLFLNVVSDLTKMRGMFRSLGRLVESTE